MLRRRSAALLTGLLTSVLLAGLLPGTAVASYGPPRPAAFATGAPTALSLTATPSEVGYAGSSALSGRLTDPATGSGIAGAAVFLEIRSSDGSWAVVAALVTDAGGAVSAAPTLNASTVYRLRHGEPGTAEHSLSADVTVAVRTLTARWSQDGVRVGRTARVLGALAAPGGARLLLEQRDGGAWRRVGRTRTAADGSYAFSVTPTAPGFWRYRVVRPATAARPADVAMLPALDAFRLHTYRVATRGSIRADMGRFRAVVAQIYDDPRGWLRSHHRFRPVRHGPGQLTVVLSQARYLPAYSWVCSTTYSCRVGRYVIINQDRWRHGSPYFPGTLAEYRAMLVNHETGHWLGRGHAYCSGKDRLAPVMQQQSKGLHGCRVNPWPLAREISAVS